MPDLKPAGNDGGERELSSVIERSLAGIEIFSDLDPEALKRLSDTCRWRRYRRGERIIEQGSESREVLFITEGSVSILVPSPTGREVAFASLGPGNHIGELAAIDGEPRSASAVAQGDTTIAIMPSDRFLRLLQGDGRVHGVHQRGRRDVALGALEAQEVVELVVHGRGVSRIRGRWASPGFRPSACGPSPGDALRPGWIW